ncbi:hypothetical protein FPQ18DRAFT_382538 [Pyronema domesticum]|nr:hypothetical protein FPQ18DRAFT_382538 [Pyronema domesticum]
MAVLLALGEISITVYVTGIPQGVIPNLNGRGQSSLDSHSIKTWVRISSPAETQVGCRVANSQGARPTTGTARLPRRRIRRIQGSDGVEANVRRVLENGVEGTLVLEAVRGASGTELLRGAVDVKT